MRVSEIEIDEDVEAASKFRRPHVAMSLAVRLSSYPLTTLILAEASVVCCYWLDSSHESATSLARASAATRYRLHYLFSFGQ